MSIRQTQQASESQVNTTVQRSLHHMKFKLCHVCQLLNAWDKYRSPCGQNYKSDKCFEIKTSAKACIYFSRGKSSSAGWTIALSWYREQPCVFISETGCLFPSTSLTPLTLCGAKSFPVESLHSSHCGSILAASEPQPDKTGRRGGWGGGGTGRIALYASERIHTEPSHFPCLCPRLLLLPYITFSNSCMDLIMVSSCRGAKEAIRAGLTLNH